MNALRRFVVQDWGVKLVALALAALLWSAVANEPPVEVTFQSPLEFRNAPQQLELSTETPATVLVRARGPASAARRLSAADLAVTLNLDSFNEPGERSFALSVPDPRLPFGVRVVQVIPARVRLRFEERAVRDIPVAPRIVGSVAPGYQLAGYQVFPATVRVVGPQSHVSVLESAATDPLDVTGVIARAQFWTSAFVSDPLVRIEGDPTVRVVVDMKRH